MYRMLLTDVGGGKDWAVGFQPPDYFVMGEISSLQRCLAVASPHSPPIQNTAWTQACSTACTYEWERQLSAEWPLEQESDNWTLAVEGSGTPMHNLYYSAMLFFCCRIRLLNNGHKKAKLSVIKVLIQQFDSALHILFPFRYFWTPSYFQIYKPSKLWCSQVQSFFFHSSFFFFYIFLLKCQCSAVLVKVYLTDQKKNKKKNLGHTVCCVLTYMRLTS